MLSKLVAGVVVGIGLIVGTALPAQAAPPPPGAIEPAPNGFCRYHNWGGTFYCTTESDSVWYMPNGRHQVFVIGPDLRVWTRWSTASGLVAWTGRLGGQCLPAHGVYYISAGWVVTIQCMGLDNHLWHNNRDSRGAWSGWIRN